MQNSSVGWDPISVDHQLPWPERLFVIYLLLVLGISTIRSINMARQFWFSGPLSKENKPADAQFRYAWEICNAKAAGMKRMAVLTLLLALLLLTDVVTNILIGLRGRSELGR